MATRTQEASRRLSAAGGFVALAAAVLVLLVAAFPSQAQAVKWHNKIVGSGHDDCRRTYGPARLQANRATRLAFWTARVWDADDREWEYDWVRFRLIRTDTGKIVKTFGPYYRPTGYKKWRTVSIKLPAGRRSYRLQAISDDARFGFQLQQRH